jgi:hypothetical protein
MALRKTAYLAPHFPLLRAFHNGLQVLRELLYLPTMHASRWLFDDDDDNDYFEFFPRFHSKNRTVCPDELRCALLADMVDVEQRVGRVVLAVKNQLKIYVFEDDPRNQFLCFFTRYSAAKNELKFLEHICFELVQFAELVAEI